MRFRGGAAERILHDLLVGATPSIHTTGMAKISAGHFVPWYIPTVVVVAALGPVANRQVPDVGGLPVLVTTVSSVITGVTYPGEVHHSQASFVPAASRT